MGFYPEPDSYSWNKIRVELKLSNYATKSELKKQTGVHKQGFVTYLATLKPNVNKLDVDKLKTVPADLSKLNNE